MSDSRIPLPEKKPEPMIYHGTYVYMLEEEPNPKTKIWSVYNKMNEHLGQIRWNAKWRQYALFVGPTKYEIVFGGRCFLEIAEFCKQQTELHKKSKRVSIECFAVIHEGEIRTGH